MEWIRTWDRIRDSLTYRDVLHMPMLLLDAFDVLEELEVQRLRYEAERAKDKG